MKKFGEFMVVLLLLAINIIVQGFIFMKLWMWFIVNTFEITSLNLIESIGIVIFIIYIKAKYEGDSGEDFWIGFKARFIFSILFALAVLLFGWIVHSLA